MLKTVSLAIAAFALLGSSTAVFAQTHYDWSSDHVYYYGPKWTPDVTPQQPHTQTQTLRHQALHVKRVPVVHQVRHN